MKRVAKSSFIKVVALVPLAHLLFQNYHKMSSLQLPGLDGKPYPEEYHMTMQEVVTGLHGYLYDEMDVHTEDGYILTMVRVRHPDTKNGAPVIFMQHGLLSSAETFVANSFEKAPAFVFARKGYDVWLGNNRGNLWSRRHERLNPDQDSREFFSYDFGDLGTYDLPAQVDKVREVTGVDKVTYMAHSQGGSQVFFAAAVDQDKIKERVNLVVALAPILRLGNTCNTLFKEGQPLIGAVEFVMDTAGLYEIAGKGWGDARSKFCHVLSPFSVCEHFDRWLHSGYKFNDDERALIASGKSHHGASWRQLLHYSQEIGSKKFERADYGSKENMSLYGQPTPPEIDVTRITEIPIAIWAGAEDCLCDPKDIEWAKDTIPAVISYTQLPNFDHDSFLLGKDTTYLADVAATIHKYNPINPLF